MKWIIPAKTFLLGEYAAIAEGSALLITTNPCFELSLSDNKNATGIHPQSPAGIWWQQERCDDNGISWYDPYNGAGGLGASSAQFLACYLATCNLKHIQPHMKQMLEAYYQCSWSGNGLKPSGYDVVAQSQTGCVYINKQKRIIQSYDWPFKNLSFFLLRTGVKLATHQHLQNSTLPSQIDYLSTLSDEGRQAFANNNSQLLINAVNNYHQTLAELNLVAQHSLDSIKSLKSIPEILALKGCGALGADILLIITAREDKQALKNQLLAENWSILASEDNLSNINTPPLLNSSF